MVRRGEVLADGQHLDVVGTQVAHDLEDFVVGLAEADHQAGLGLDLRVARLEVLHQLQRVRVIGARACLPVKPGDSLEVVVEDVRQPLAEDVEGDVEAAAEVGDQRFDGRRRRGLAYGADDIDKMAGSAVAQVVAVDAGDDDILQLERGNRIRQFSRLVRVGRQRLAVAHVAERAAAGADVAEDHEGCRAAPEALADVGAGGFLADRVQLLLAQHGLDLAEAPGAVAGLDADPLRLLERGIDRDDLDRDARSLEFALLLDALLLGGAGVFSHVLGPVAAANVARGARLPRER